MSPARPILFQVYATSITTLVIPNGFHKVHPKPKLTLHPEQSGLLLVPKQLTPTWCWCAQYSFAKVMYVLHPSDALSQSTLNMLI